MNKVLIVNGQVNWIDKQKNMMCVNFHQPCTITHNNIVQMQMFGLDTACTTSKPPGGPGREEMASLPEIREMETKTEPKMTKLRNYKPQNIYTNGIITLELINDAEICVPIPLSF